MAMTGIGEALASWNLQSGGRKDMRVEGERRDK